MVATRRVPGDRESPRGRRQRVIIHSIDVIPAFECGFATIAGALADLPEIEALVADVNDARRGARDRPAPAERVRDVISRRGVADRAAAGS